MNICTENYKLPIVSLMILKEKMHLLDLRFKTINFLFYYHFDLLAFIWFGKIQSNMDIFRIDPIPVSPITARSESTRRFDNRKKKSRVILEWLINKGIITWCFSYWPCYRPIWQTSRNNTVVFNSNHKWLNVLVQISYFLCRSTW